MSRAGSRILESAREALAFAEGKADPAGFRVHVPEDIDVGAIRRKIGMTQEVFARHFGVSKRTVQDWEQRHRRPSGAARAFLRVIDREPAAVRRALGEDFPAAPDRAAAARHTGPSGAGHGPGS